MKVIWYGSGLNVVMRDRGMQYYRHNQVHVQSVEVTELAEFRFTAEVEGTDVYHVTAELNDMGKISSLSCTCPYAAAGNSCKHMAALLHHISNWNVPKELYREMLSRRAAAEAIRRQREDEARRAAEEEKLRKEREFFASRKPVLPFARPASAPYRYFDFGAITAPFLILDKDYEEAQRLAANVRLPSQIRYAYSRDGLSEELICIHDNSSLSGIVITRDRILHHLCNVRSCRCSRIGYYPVPGGKRALCPGMLAGLILMQNWIEENTDRGDATSYSARQMLDIFLKKANREKSSLSAGGRAVRLEPTLQQSGDLLSLTWKIGAEKLFVVKNLTNLVDAVQGRNTYPLGKSTALQFDRDRFDERSEKYYAMILEAVRETTELNRRQAEHRNWYSAPALPEIKGSMPLFGSRLDLFYDAAPRSGLQMIRSRGGFKDTFALQLAEANPELKLVVNQVVDAAGVFHGVRLHGMMPELIRGGQYQYMLTEDGTSAALIRILPEGAERLLPFRPFISDGKLDLTVGRDHLSAFYYTVLPELKKLAAVEEPDDALIQEYLPPPAEFAVYLDAVDRVPVARVTVAYGENTVSLLDWQKPGFVREAFRSVPAEQEAANLIGKYFPFPDPGKDLYRCGDTSDAILRLLDEGLSELTAFCPVHSTQAFDALRIRRMPAVQVGISLSDGGLLDLTVSSEELSREELLELLESYRQKKNYHRLRSGSWVRLDQDAAELSLLMEALHVSPKEFVSGKMHIPAYRALYLDKMLEESDHFHISRDQQFRKLIKEFKTVSDSDFEPPASLEKVLRPYQAYGFKWLRTLAEYGFGGILADDMGLGKTLQMIAVLLSAKEAGETDPSLIVCPASLVYNWQEECFRFAPQLKTLVIAGTPAERELRLKKAAGSDVLITSYDLLKRDILQYAELQFNVMVIDEAQFVKTQTTAAAKSVRLVHARRRFALTGTPIENRLSELWSIFDFLMPGYLYNYETFRRQFETPIARSQDPEIRSRLQKMIRPFILRRLKADVLKELPDKLEEVRYVRFGDEQQRLYDAQATKIRVMLEKASDEEMNRSRIQILSQLTRIRQICCDPSLLFEDYRASSAKREACLDLIRSAMDGGHRILVFSQFTSMLALLEKDLADAGIEWYSITGATPKAERVDLVRRFNEGNTPVFLISLKAGGTGLNLTGADTVIHYDPWWNVAAQNQATDRAHRIGQTRTVCVYKLIGKDTVEEKILKLQQDKQDLAEEILSGEGRALSSMTREELMDLLG